MIVVAKVVLVVMVVVFANAGAGCWLLQYFCLAARSCEGKAG